MRLENFCQNYFLGFQEIFAKEANIEQRLIGIIKVISYATLVVPLGFGIALAACKCLAGRAKKDPPRNSSAEKTKQIAQEEFANLTGDAQSIAGVSKVTANQVSDPSAISMTASEVLAKATLSKLKPIDISDAELKARFKEINSSEVKEIGPVKRADIKFIFQIREVFLENHEWITYAPVISKSSFVPKKMVEHLMRNKKDVAINKKFEAHQENGKLDCITNMEGVLHSFVTPVIAATISHDYAFNLQANAHAYLPVGGHGEGREVIISTAIQPDFEDDQVMMALCSLEEESIKGEALTKKFKILDAKSKQDEELRREYDQSLKKHMIYHLTRSHQLPAVNEIDGTPIDISFQNVKGILEDYIKQESAGSLQELIEGHFVKLGGKILSLEVLFNCYVEQLRNEFSVLESLLPQGYVYTIDPPSIFLNGFNLDKNKAGLILNRLQILAFKFLAQEGNFKNLKAIGFNDYMDTAAVELLKEALAPNSSNGGVAVDVMAKASLFPRNSSEMYSNGCYQPHEKYKNCALVLHTNSDAFGQNIETEGPTSLDGVIGCCSDTAKSVERSRLDLVAHIV